MVSSVMVDDVGRTLRALRHPAIRRTAVFPSGDCRIASGLFLSVEAARGQIALARATNRSPHAGDDDRDLYARHPRAEGRADGPGRGADPAGTRGTPVTFWGRRRGERWCLARPKPRGLQGWRDPDSNRGHHDFRQPYANSDRPEPPAYKRIRAGRGRRGRSPQIAWICPAIGPWVCGRGPIRH